MGIAVHERARMLCVLVCVCVCARKTLEDGGGDGTLGWVRILAVTAGGANRDVGDARRNGLGRGRGRGCGRGRGRDNGDGGNARGGSGGNEDAKLTNGNMDGGKSGVARISCARTQTIVSEVSDRSGHAVSRSGKRKDLSGHA